VTTCNYNAIANLHTLQVTAANANSTQLAMSSCTRYLAEAFDNMDSLYCFCAQRFLSSLAGDSITISTGSILSSKLLLALASTVNFGFEPFLVPWPNLCSSHHLLYFVCLEMESPLRREEGSVFRLVGQAVLMSQYSMSKHFKINIALQSRTCHHLG
jgi:hypothetical protein